MNGGIFYLMDHCGSRIYLKKDRDDAFSYGGNKVRIAEELLKDLRAGGYTALISYGSPSSNMNRAAADIAKREGLPCYVIIKIEENPAVALSDGNRLISTGGEKNISPVGKKDAPNDENGYTHVCAVQHMPPMIEDATGRMPENERLVRAAGAEVFYCTASTVRETVEHILSVSRERGEKPYYIYGDSSGHGNEVALMRASYQEYAGIRKYEEEHGILFDRIVLTVGTGMTVSGLAAAMRDDGGRSGLLGISAARGREALREISAQNLRRYPAAEPKGGDGVINRCESVLPEFRDDYLGGGYGKGAAEIDTLIERMEKEYGLCLDPVYTAKGFYGMLREIEQGHIAGNILFLHTGGYPNYLDWKKSKPGQ